VERWTVESLSPTIHKKPLFLRVKPRDLRNPQVPPKAKPDHNKNLILVTPFLLHLPLLLGARGRETMSKIPAPPSLLAAEESCPEEEGVFDPYDEASVISS
jgi:hypothetical protein